MIVEKGDKLPIFSLQGIDENGEEKQYTNQNFSGKKLVIYFYPKDNTPGCTKESCAFNLLYSEIKSKSNIVGVSADSLDSHLNFRNKYQLQFPLLSDDTLSLAKSLGASKVDIFGKLKIARTTFLFDEKGFLIKAWYSVKVAGHDQEILNEINSNNS